MRVSSIKTITCPRCHAPVQGEFKYCPECAFRLRPGPPTDDEQSPAGRRGTLLLLLAGAALMATGVWLGVRVFGKPNVVVPVHRTRPLTVADIQDHLIQIPEGVALWEPQPIWTSPPEDELTDTFLETLEQQGPDPFREALLEPSLLENSMPLTSWRHMLTLFYEHADSLVEEKLTHVELRTEAFKMMEYELTRGQWAEFLRSVEKDPSQLSALEYVRDLWRPPLDGEANPLAYARRYRESWWEGVREVHQLRNENLPEGERLPPLRRPRWLDGDRLTDEQGVKLLIPPAWVVVGPETGEITWRLAPPVEGVFGIDDAIEDMPVTGVSWWDVHMFIDWLRREIGIPTLALPNGAEWLRAFHGGNPYHPPDDFHPTEILGNVWPWGSYEDLVGCNNYNWVREGQLPRLESVRRPYSNHRGATVDGVLNMAGNAAEWTDNWFPYRKTGYARTLDENGSEYFLDLNAVLGGSYQKGIGDCKASSSEALDKRARRIDVGFRLILRQSVLGR